MRVERRGGAPQERARRFELRRHVGELELQRLEIRDALAEGLALARVGERLVERRLRAAERAGADIEPAAVEPGHGDLEADALVRQAVRDGTRTSSKITCAGRLRVPAHLLLVARRTTGRACPSRSTSVEMPLGPSSPVRTIVT